MTGTQRTAKNFKKRSSSKAGLGLSFDSTQVGSPALLTQKGVADFEKGGINRETAQKIIKVWEETGSRNPDDLRKFLLKRSATTAGVVLLQTLVDAGDQTLSTRLLLLASMQLGC